MWRLLLKGARLISNDYERVIVYQKQGSLDEAVEDFYSVDPTEVLKVGFRLSSFDARHLSGVMRQPTIWFSTWSDTNQAVQLQKMGRVLKFRVAKVEVLYYLCSENKGADQLRGYREADLRLCFRICKILDFS